MKPILNCLAVTLALLVTTSCVSGPTRTPQSEQDLLTELLAMKGEVEVLNSETCHAYFTSKIKSLREERFQTIAKESAKIVSEKIMLTTWQLRLKLHKQLAELSSCRTELRDLFYQLRSVEDVAHLVVYGVEQKSMADLGDMQKQPVPLKDNQFYHGYLGKSGSVQKTQVNFAAGDIILSRGGSFFSAFLGTIASHPSQLDHFGLVAADPASGNLMTLESFAQDDGVSRYALDFALKNENARMVLLRPKDQVVGRKAADLMMTRIMQGEKDAKLKIHYDYAMNLEDPRKMTCSAVSYWAYRWASDDHFVLPEEPSRLMPNLDQIYTELGIKKLSMLTAQDAELDSRFELILEFRDPRLIEDSRIREVVTRTLVKWMNDDGYRLRRTLKSTLIEKVIYPLRRTKLWPLIAKLTGQDFPKDTPKGFIKVLQQLNAVSDILYKQVHTANRQAVALTGWPMSQDQMALVLEEYRAADLEKCMSDMGPAPLLHFMISKDRCVNKAVP